MVNKNDKTILILGLVSIICACIPLLSAITGIIAIAKYYEGWHGEKRGGSAIAGMLLSTYGTIINCFFMGFMIRMFIV